jgi:hypothetical protein
MGRYISSKDKSVSSQEYLLDTQETAYESYNKILEEEEERIRSRYATMVKGMQKILFGKEAKNNVQKIGALKKIMNEYIKEEQQQIKDIRARKFTAPQNCEHDHEVYSIPISSPIDLKHEQKFNTVEKHVKCSICSKTEDHFHSFAEDLKNPEGVPKGHHQWCFFKSN